MTGTSLGLGFIGQFAAAFAGAFFAFLFTRLGSFLTFVFARQRAHVNALVRLEIQFNDFYNNSINWKSLIERSQCHSSLKYDGSDCQAAA